jgi:hypothetical protein
VIIRDASKDASILASLPRGLVTLLETGKCSHIANFTPGTKAASKATISRFAPVHTIHSGRSPITEKK